MNASAKRRPISSYIFTMCASCSARGAVVSRAGGGSVLVVRGPCPRFFFTSFICLLSAVCAAVLRVFAGGASEVVRACIADLFDGATDRWRNQWGRWWTKMDAAAIGGVSSLLGFLNSHQLRHHADEHGHRDAQKCLYRSIRRVRPGMRAVREYDNAADIACQLCRRRHMQ